VSLIGQVLRGRECEPEPPETETLQEFKVCAIAIAKVWSSSSLKVVQNELALGSTQEEACADALNLD
jgi:hypothetical protein